MPSSVNKGGWVPKLRFPEFRGAGEWEEKRLEDFAIIVRGGSPRPIDEYITNDPNGLSWLKIGDIDKESKYVTCTQEKVIPAALNKTRMVSPGDLILSNSMSFGRPYILEIVTCIHDGWIAVSEIDKSLDRDYLYYLMMTSASQTYFSNNAAGSGVQNLNADIIKLLPVSYPSKKEQQKIADCLASLDELITLEAQKLDTLKTHKKGLMQQLFPAEGETLPKLRFPEFREAGKWQEKKAGSLFANRVEDGEEGLPIYSVTMNDGMVKRSSLERRVDDIAESGGNKKVRKGDIAYNMMRMWQGAFGVSKEDCMVSPAYVVLSPESDTYPDFFGYLFKLPKYLQLLTSHSQGLTLDRLRLYYKDFARIPVLTPSPLEQQRIADCFASLDDLITAQAQKLAALKTHKKGLMQQLFPALSET